MVTMSPRNDSRKVGGGNDDRESSGEEAKFSRRDRF